MLVRPRSLASTALLALGLAACGDPPIVHEAQSRPPLTAADVAAAQSGDTVVRIEQGVTYRVDDAGLLEVRVTLHSSAAVPETVSVRGNLFDAQGVRLGQVTGGSAPIPPGGSVTVQLTGEPPQQTIARTVFDVSAKPAASP